MRTRRWRFSSSGREACLVGGDSAVRKMLAGAFGHELPLGGIENCVCNQFESSSSEALAITERKKRCGEGAPRSVVRYAG